MQCRNSRRSIPSELSGAMLLPGSFVIASLIDLLSLMASRCGVPMYSYKNRALAIYSTVAIPCQAAVISCCELCLVSDKRIVFTISSAQASTPMVLLRQRW